MKVAYLLNSYPMTSTTFINREIWALERLGVSVERFAIRVWDQTLVEDSDISEQAKTRYILSGGVFRLLLAPLLELLRNPVGLLRAIALWLRYTVQTDVSLLKSTAYLFEAIRFRQMVRGRGIDHVHCHFGTNATTVAMLAHVMGAPGYSFTVHGPDEIDNHHTCHYPMKVAHARFVVAISHFCRVQLAKFCGMQVWDKLHVVRCGINLDDFPKTAAPAGDNHNFLCIGRLTYQKAQSLFPKALAKVRETVPNATITLIGDGDTRGDIVQKAEEYGVTDGIILAGWQDHEGVRRHLLNARALLLPSFGEGLPIVIMEALAMGVPVITSFIAGIPELVDEKVGWIIPAGSEDDIADAMLACLNTAPGALAAMGDEGRIRVEDRHDVNKSAAALKGLFAEQV